jgi:hypothetical protein
VGGSVLQTKGLLGSFGNTQFFETGSFRAVMQVVMILARAHSHGEQVNMRVFGLAAAEQLKWLRMWPE